MAAVTRVKARPVSPPGYEVNDKGYIVGACTTGDLLVQDGAAALPYGYEMVWVKAVSYTHLTLPTKRIV